jgi:hypothetical protein
MNGSKAAQPVGGLPDIIAAAIVMRTMRETPA